MKKPTFERKMILLAAGAFALFAIGAAMTTILPPLVNKELHSAEPDQKVHVYTEQENRGRKIYSREGCVYCHTQQVRDPVTNDGKRYGWRLVDAPRSEAWEYVNDEPHFIGTKRTGPDLARVGGKYASEWHWSHFKNPRDLGERFYEGKENPQKGSIMQSFKFLTDEEIKDLTAYLQTLGKNQDWREYKGKKLNDYEK